MAQLFSRWESGTQVTAGTMVGSVMGASGLNTYADRLNSISDNNNAVTGSMVSGTSSCFVGSVVNALNVSGTNMTVYVNNGNMGIRNYEQKSGLSINNVTDTYTSIGSIYIGHNAGDLILINYSINGNIDSAGAYNNSALYRAGNILDTTRRISASAAGDDNIYVPHACSYIEIASTTGSTLFDLRVNSTPDDNGDFDRGLLNGIVFRR